MAKPPPPRDTILLPPTDAVAVWEQRGALRPSVNWSEIMHGEHAAAFTVAKVAKLDLLASIRASLDEVIRSGGTFEGWKANILPELIKHGWWGVVQDEALTGTADPITVNDARLRTIFNTNVRMSIAAGRWRKYQREKAIFPYLRYVSDHFRQHPRLNHRSWHGLILHIDDPAWQWLYPPNGWGCRCKVEQVSEARLQRNGWSVGVAPTPKQIGFVTATGETIMVPEGVAPGFAYNPGTAHLRVLAERAFVAIERAIGAGEEVAAQDTLSAIVADAAFDQFAAMPEGAFPVTILDAATAADWTAGERLMVLQGGDGTAALRTAAAGQAGANPGISALRLLPDLVNNAIIVARTDEGLLVWYEAPGNVLTGAARAVFRARVLLRTGLPPRIIEVSSSSAEDAAAESAGLDIVLDRTQ